MTPLRSMLLPGPRRWRAVARVVAVVVLLVMGVLYTNHVQRQSEQKWCRLLAVLTSGPSPTTDRGQVVVTALKDLREDFHCPSP